jgi:hypothetical protein
MRIAQRLARRRAHERALAWLLLAGVALSGIAWARPLPAAEPVEEFLSALRARKYFDTAREYLQSLPSNPNVSDEIKALVPYELGRILVDDSKDERVTSERLKQLDQAAVYFNEFLTKNPTHDSAGMARIQLGSVLVERARSTVDLANRPGSAAKKNDLLAEARKQYVAARAAFEAVVKDYDARLKKYPNFVPKTDKKIREEKNAVRKVLIEASFHLANTYYQEAESYDDAASKERKTLFTTSAAEFHKIYEKYRTVLAGLYAGMWEARSYQELGDLRRAIGLYLELLQQPDEPEAFRELRNKVLKLAMECWNDSRVGQPEESEQRGKDWVDHARPGEDSSPEGLAIQYFTAQAKHLIIQKLKEPAKKEGSKKEAKPAAKEDRHRELDIVKLLRRVADYPGDYQKSAKELLARYRELKQADPETFAEAYEQGKLAFNAYEEYVEKSKASKSAPEQEKTAKDAEIALNDAVRLFRLALLLKEKDKKFDIKESIDDLNAIRYYLAFAYFKQGGLHDAAVQGEMLAQHYPKFAGSQQAGWIALVAWVNLYNNADPGDGRRFEAMQMNRVAEMITQHWPGSQQADQSWMVLADVAIREDDLERAKTCLEKIKPDSPRRGEADLKLGQANFRLYLRNMRLPTKPPQAELDKLLKDAEAQLIAGIKAARKQVAEGTAVGRVLLGGELSLAQIYVNRGTPEGAKLALGLVTNGKDLLIDLFKQGNEEAKYGILPQEGLKVQLRACVTLGDIKQASDALDQLKKLTAGKADAHKQLMALFISLGREIEGQIKSAAPEQKTKLVESFDQFLKKILEGGTDTLDFNSLTWVGATYVGLADGLAVDGKRSSAAAPYFAQALATYTRMKEIKLPEKTKLEEELKSALAARADKEKIDQIKAELRKADDMLNAIDTRRARCETGAGRYQEAIDILGEVLMRKETDLDAQREACITFQEWGAAVDPKQFIRARAGSPVKGKRGVIWGWAMMSRKLQPYVKQPDAENLRNMFFDARLEFSKSFYDHAMLVTNATEKEKLVDYSYDSIDKLYRMYTSEINGNTVWKKSFDELLTKVKAASTKPRMTLSEIEQDIQKNRKAETTAAAAP